MAWNALSIVVCPANQLVSCVHSSPEPISPGIWSEASKPNSVAFFSSSCDFFWNSVVYSDASKSLCGDRKIAWLAYPF